MITERKSYIQVQPYIRSTEKPRQLSVGSVKGYFEQMKVMFVKNKKATTVVVTRVFTGKSGKLIDLYANYVAKRIMFDNGMIRSAEVKTAGDNAKMPLTLTI